MGAKIATASPVSSHATGGMSGYIRVKGEMLRRLPATTVDLFVQYESKGPFVLYHRAGTSIDSQRLGTCMAGGVEELFVRVDDFQCLGAQVLQAVEATAQGESVPVAERYAALQLAMAMEIERSTQSIDCRPYIALADQLGHDLISLLEADRVLPRDLFRLARHDFNTFTHVTNVAGYAIILARRLGLCEPDTLHQIAAGAMLHDIGKRFIPAAILTKPTRLEPRERALIETHPTRGYEDLCHRPEVSFEQLMMVYQHHERIDGTGYPVGIPGSEIHPWAKLLAVVDTFDAMTGIRPYRRSASAHSALNYLGQQAGSHFDNEVVQCWQSAMTEA